MKRYYACGHSVSSSRSGEFSETRILNLSTYECELSLEAALKVIEYWKDNMDKYEKLIDTYVQVYGDDNKKCEIVNYTNYVTPLGIDIIRGEYR